MPENRGLRVVTLTPSCGYGDAGSHYAAGLHAQGVPVTWFPIHGGLSKVLPFEKAKKHLNEVIRDDVLTLWQRALECGAMLVNVPPPDVQPYWRQREPNLRPFTYVAWEVEQLPDTWPLALNDYERVFVPSLFNQRALVTGGVTAPVDVVPHIAREVTPVYGGPAWGSVADEDFVFYTIGSWSTRKAMEETICAYLDAFTNVDKVALIIKTDAINQAAFKALSVEERKTEPPHIAMVWWAVAQILARYKNPAKIHLIADGIPPQEIDRLHTRGDCFFSLTHSEGWGLGPFDAALFGNPVIVTGWGGQLDYLGAEYPLLVRYEMEPTNKYTPDGFFMRTEGTDWAAADQAHAGELMRYVFENQDKARAIGRELQPQLQRRYGSEVISRQLAELMGYEIG